MAEICFECYNKRSGNNEKKHKYIISRELDLCDECGEWKPVIIRMKYYYLYKEQFTEWIEDMRTLYGRKS